MAVIFVDADADADEAGAAASVGVDKGGAPLAPPPDESEVTSKDLPVLTCSNLAAISDTGMSSIDTRNRLSSIRPSNRNVWQ